MKNAYVILNEEGKSVGIVQTDTISAEAVAEAIESHYDQTPNSIYIQENPSRYEGRIKVVLDDFEEALTYDLAELFQAS